MIEEFSESRNLSRVAAGMKGGPFNKNPVVVPARTIVNGTAPTSMEKLHASMQPQPKPQDPWIYRRPNGKMAY